MGIAQMSDYSRGWLIGVIGGTTGSILTSTFIVPACRTVSPDPGEYRIFATVIYNRADSVKVSEIRNSLLKFSDACLIQMEVDTLHGDTVLLGSIEDLVVAPIDTMEGE